MPQMLPSYWVILLFCMSFTFFVTVCLMSFLVFPSSMNNGSSSKNIGYIQKSWF